MGERGRARVLCVALLLLLLPGCVKQSLHTDCLPNNIIDENYDKQLQFLIHQEALLTTVPLPIYDERILFPSFRSNDEQETIFLAYKSPLKKNQLIQFFTIEMERYGWAHIVAFSSSCMHILQFHSPDSYCTITVQELDENSVRFDVYVKKERALQPAPGSELG